MTKRTGKKPEAAPATSTFGTTTRGRATHVPPAAGSGGFLIRAFEHVRAKIAAEIQDEKDRKRTEIEALELDPDEEDARTDAAFAALNRELLPSDDLNRPAGRLAWRCIFGCDAEPRAARTAKINMIMHGDGHGGIHYHDGLVDINGIFPVRVNEFRPPPRPRSGDNPEAPCRPAWRRG